MALKPRAKALCVNSVVNMKNRYTQCPKYAGIFLGGITKHNRLTLCTKKCMCIGHIG